MSRETEADKRQRILMAAARVFAERGFHQATVADIAVEAGVGKGTIYEYFSSKEELFRQVVIDLWGTYTRYLTNLCREDLPLPKFLEKLLGDSVNFLLERHHLVQLLLADHPLLGQDMFRFFRKMKKEHIRQLSDYVSRKIEKKEMRPFNPWLVATIILHVLAAMGEYLVWELHNSSGRQTKGAGEEVEVVAQAVKAAVRDMLLNGLSPA